MIPELMMVEELKKSKKGVALVAVAAVVAIGRGKKRSSPLSVPGGWEFTNTSITETGVNSQR